MLIVCCLCSVEFERAEKAVKQSAKRGQKNYCSKACSSVARRNKDKKAYYKSYQEKYRNENKDKIKEIQRRKYSRIYGEFAPSFISLRMLENEITSTQRKKESLK